MTAPRGLGIGLRREHFATLELDVAEALSVLDFVEIIPENFVARGGRSRSILDAVRSKLPVLAHGVSLSLGGNEPLDLEWLRALKRFLDDHEIPFFTEHLSFTSANGVASHELLPLPFFDDVVTHVAERARLTMDVLERPLLLENPSAIVRMPGDLDEGTFTKRVLDASGAGLLLDVNNIHVTAMNVGIDDMTLLGEMPFHRVRQIHVAGHRNVDGALVDTHEGPVPDVVIPLLKEAARRLPDVPILLEWDTNIPPLDVVLAEAARLRAIVDAARAARPAELVVHHPPSRTIVDVNGP